jgi:multidrug efflux pump subunit AcrA (membrane-fusion protein)
MRKTIFLLAVSTAILLTMWHKTLFPEKAISVEALRTEYSDILKSISTTGVIREIRSKKLYPEKNAVVEAVYINNGDTVTEGQVLMLLKSISDASAYAGKIEDFSSELNGLGIDLNDIAPDSIEDYLAGESENEYFLITSPFRGTVTDIAVSAGESVSALTVCAEVSDISRIQAVVKIRESDISRIKTGMPVLITGESLAGSYNGVVLNVSPRIEAVSSILGGSGNYGEAVVELYKPDERLFLGGSVTAKILVSKKSNGIFVPYEAVDQNSDNQEICYVVSGGKAELRVIETGEDYSNTIEVLDGLSAGELLITSSDAELYDGAAVTVIEGEKY